MGIEGPFILCPHSLSGLEATLWAQKYPEEVEAIVGLDMSSANYAGLAEIKEGFAQKTAINLNKIVRFSGINRFLMSISEFDATYTDEELRQYKALVCRNQANDTVCRENDAIGEVCEEINATALPSTPTLQFVSTYNSNYEYWKSTHQELVDASTYGKLIELDCDHYLHQFESERIAEEMRDFIDGLK
jgi:pimeloyl-ACP methyl ester carboxylesterase